MFWNLTVTLYRHTSKCNLPWSWVTPLSLISFSCASDLLLFPFLSSVLFVEVSHRPLSCTCFCALVSPSFLDVFSQVCFGCYDSLLSFGFSEPGKADNQTHIRTHAHIYTFTHLQMMFSSGCFVFCHNTSLHQFTG